MADVQYVCTGSCRGIVAEAQFNAGSNVCGADGCERKGQSLVMKLFCPSCEIQYGQEETHECD